MLSQFNFSSLFKIRNRESPKTSLLIELCKENNITSKQNFMKALKKSDINAQTQTNKKTALHFSVANENIMLIQILLDNNANIFLKDIAGYTPFQLAVMANLDVWKLFMEHIEKNQFKISDYSDDKTMIENLMVSLRYKNFEALTYIYNKGLEENYQWTNLYKGLIFTSSVGWEIGFLFLLPLVPVDIIEKQCRHIIPPKENSKSKPSRIYTSLMCNILKNSMITSFNELCKLNLSEKVLNCPQLTIRGEEFDYKSKGLNWYFIERPVYFVFQMKDFNATLAKNFFLLMKSKNIKLQTIKDECSEIIISLPRLYEIFHESFELFCLFLDGGLIPNSYVQLQMMAVQTIFQYDCNEIAGFFCKYVLPEPEVFMNLIIEYFIKDESNVDHELKNVLLYILKYCEFDVENLTELENWIMASSSVKFYDDLLDVIQTKKYRKFPSLQLLCRKVIRMDIKKNLKNNKIVLYDDIMSLKLPPKIHSYLIYNYIDDKCNDQCQANNLARSKEKEKNN